MLHRIKNRPTSLTEYITRQENKTDWLKETERILTLYGIDKEQFLRLKPSRAKMYTRKIVHKKFREELFKNPQKKSKINYLISGYLGTEKALYTNNLNRSQTSILFKARTRMLDIKDNYRNKYTDLKCRLCGKHEETQQHILTECESTIDDHITIQKDMLFSRSTILLSITANKIKETLAKLQK